MAHAGVDHLRSACGGPIAQAVVVGAQKGATLDHFAWYPKLRLLGVVAGCFAAWITGPGVGVPVARPLPHIAGHVEEAIAVGRESTDWSGSAVSAIGTPREITVPVVGQALPGPFRFVTPGVRRVCQTAACSDLPFGLPWQLQSGPGRIGLSVLIGDVHHRVISPPDDR